VLGVTGVVSLTAAGVLAVNDRYTLQASKVLGIGGVLTIGAAGVLAVTGAVSLPAAAVIGVTGAITLGAAELINIVEPGGPDQTTTTGTSNNPNDPTDIPDSAVDDVPQSSGAKNVPDGFGVPSGGGGGYGWDDRPMDGPVVNTTSGNRAKNSRSEPVRVEVSDNRTITVEQKRDLMQRDDLTEAVKQEVLRELERRGR